MAEYVARHHTQRLHVSRVPAESGSQDERGLVPQDPIRATSRPKVTVRPNFAKDFSAQSSGTTESDTLQSVSCAKNSLHIFKLGTGRLVANSKTGSSDRRTIPGRASGTSPSRPRSKERTGSPMLSGFFVHRPDKNQLLKELHNNSNEDYTFLNSSARKLSKHMRTWKALSYWNCPDRFKVALLAIYHSTLMLQMRSATLSSKGRS